MWMIPSYKHRWCELRVFLPCYVPQLLPESIFSDPCESSISLKSYISCWNYSCILLHILVHLVTFMILLTLYFSFLVFPIVWLWKFQTHRGVEKLYYEHSCILCVYTHIYMHNQNVDFTIITLLYLLYNVCLSIYEP